jgi:predicted MFS family arabinose efflux permease
LQGLRAHPVGVVLALSLGAAVSLGITRFAYALLLPVMRADLGWSYTLAGAMNTVNALGYLLGALAAPALLRRLAPGTLLLWGAVLATLFMALSGFFIEAVPLLLQRLLAGVASAVIFIAGGLMAARLGALDVGRSGLLLGLYYGGVGWGISASALLVPPVLAVAPALHGWTWAWWALAAVCALATAVLVWPVRALRGLTAPATAPAPAKGLSVGASGAEGAKAVAQHAAPPSAAPVPAVPLRALAPALLGYTLFGVGYIGYMTFVVALLREQGMASGTVTLFYALLGLAVVLSSRIWAGLLDRSRGGRALAVAQWPAGCGHAAAGTDLGLARSAGFGPAVWRGVPGGGGLDHRAGAPQPAARAVGRRHQRIHCRVCCRADRGAHGGGLDCRRPRRAGARPGVFGLRAVAGGAGGSAPAAAGFDKDC